MPEEQETPQSENTQVDRKRIDLGRAFTLFAKHRSYEVVAKMLGCSRQAVHQLLKHYSGFLEELAHVEDFRANRSDMLSAAEGRLLRSCLDEQAIKKAPLAARATTFGILNERRRLEEGKSTQNLLHGAILRIQRDALELTVKGSKPGVSQAADGVATEGDAHSEHTNSDDIAAK